MITDIHAIETVVMPSHGRLRRDNITFYRDLLHLPLEYGRCRAGRIVFRLHQKRLFIDFDHPVDVNSNFTRASFQVKDLKETFDRLLDAGYKAQFHLGWSPATQRVFVIDPTGYRIELYQVLPMFGMA